MSSNLPALPSSVEARGVTSSCGNNRSPMTGSADQIREDTARLRDIGVTHLIQSLPALGFDPTATVENMLALTEQLIEISE